MTGYDEIAIPSHRRPGLLQQTLAALKTTAPVRVFVSDREELDRYRQAGFLPRSLVLTNCPDLTSKFNFIHQWYEPGARVFCMEDDVSVVERAPDGSTGATVPVADLDALVRRGFELIPNGGIFGLAPHHNAFYFTGKITSTLKLVVAHAFGFVGTRDPALEVTQPSKTDYERTCRYFVRYGETWRLDFAGCKTKSYTAPGGMQADYTREERAALEQQSCNYLVRHFPHLIDHNRKKKSLFAELRFKPCRLQPAELRDLQVVLERKLRQEAP